MSDINIDNKVIRKKFCSLVALGILGQSCCFASNRTDIVLTITLVIPVKNRLRESEKLRKRFYVL